MHLFGDILNDLRSRFILPPFAKEIEKALYDSEILRNHLTVEIKTPDSWKQEYRVTYRNKRKKLPEVSDGDRLNCVRLAPRRKIVQRNLSVFDRNGGRLTIVPSDLVHDAMIKICKFYLQEARMSAGVLPEEEPFRGLIQNIDFSDAFSYSSNPMAVQGVLDTIGNLADEFQLLPLESAQTLFCINRIHDLVRIYKYFYIPIVKLEEPLDPRDCILLSYSVENLMRREQQLRGLTLYTLGYLKINFPLELEPNASNHIRMLSPSGMLFCKAGIPDLYFNLEEFMDDDMIYFHIPKEKAKEIVQQQKVRRVRGEDLMKINVTIGVSKGFLERPTLTRILSVFMYVAMLLPFIAAFFPRNGFDFSFTMILGSALLVLTILISLAVYSMDKRFLHDYLVAHVLIFLILFIFEILLLILYTPHDPSAQAGSSAHFHACAALLL